MLSRIYTIQTDNASETKSYKGLNQNRRDGESDDIICLVQVEDIIEVWYLDSGKRSKAELEFIRFMAERDDAELCTILGIYQRK